MHGYVRARSWAYTLMILLTNTYHQSSSAPPAKDMRERERGHVCLRLLAASARGHVCLLAAAARGHVCLRLLAAAARGHVCLLAAAARGHVCLLAAAEHGHVCLLAAAEHGHVCLLAAILQWCCCEGSPAHKIRSVTPHT